MKRSVWLIVLWHHIFSVIYLHLANCFFSTRNDYRAELRARLSESQKREHSYRKPKHCPGIQVVCKRLRALLPPVGMNICSTAKGCEENDTSGRHWHIQEKGNDLFYIKNCYCCENKSATWICLCMTYITYVCLRERLYIFIKS